MKNQDIKTMKIYLLRHGEAEFGNPKGDFYRTLSEEGRSQVARLGGVLRQRQLYFDCVICSSAIRTLETKDLVLNFVNAGMILETSELYEAELESLVSYLNRIPKECKRTLLIGHNPGISALVDFLSGSGFTHMDTGMMAILDSTFEDWSLLGRDSCGLLEFIR